MKKGIIVYFPQNGYSVKTDTKCFWCRRQFWGSAEAIKNDALFTNTEFLTNILQASPSISSVTRDIFDNWENNLQKK